LESFDLYVKRTHSPEIQSLRGKLSGKVRKKGSLEEKKPWIDMGISRRKYFYLISNKDK